MNAAHEQVRDDFDRIARLAADDTDHGEILHPFLLDALPARLESALEVGCGAGGFTRRLAGLVGRVLALDLSPEMIRVARERSPGHANIVYEVADVMSRVLPSAGFDAIASIATLHHVPLEPALLRLKEALRPGGTLLVLDLFTPVSPSDWLAHLGSYPFAALLQLAGVRRAPTREARRLWAEHGRRDRYPALGEVRALAARHLPGAYVRRHLPWRFSLMWRKP